MTDARQVIRSLLEDREDVDPFTAVLAMPSVMSWAGYSDVEGLKYLGEGDNGVAYKVNDKLALKITRDPSEADAANKIKGRRLSNVNRIYKVAEISNATERFGLSVWIILEDFLPNELNDLEASAVNDFSSVMNEFAWDTNQSVSEIAWEDRKTRQAFQDYIEQATHIDSIKRDLKKVRVQRVFADIMRGLTALRRSGVGFADLKDTNVLKNSAGRLVIFDLGVSRTRGPAAMDIIEKIRLLRS